MAGDRNLLPPTRSAGGCLTRIVWILYGSQALLVSAGFISHQGEVPTLSLPDVVYWGTFTLCLGLSGLDLVHLSDPTGQNRAARIRLWLRGGLIAGGAAVALWLAAHGVALFLVK